MRYAFALWLVVACGAGSKPHAQQPTADPRVVAREALLKALPDAAALAQLLRGSVVNGGLWFHDAACRKFQAGKLDPNLAGDFARGLVCL
jgi:hypothetical protein